MVDATVSFAREGLKLALQIRRIRNGRRLGISKSELARAHFHIEQRYLQNKYFDFKVGSTIDALGYQFNFLSYDTFRYLFNEIFLKEDYYFESKTESPVIVDCGTNIGASILYFKKLYPKATIVGFEPYDRAFDTLKTNIEANHLGGVTIHNVALSGSNGELDLFFEPSNPGSLRVSLFQERTEGREGASGSVQARTLSQYLESPVDFLKMDIEGAEDAVLEELSESRKLSLVRRMAVEYHHHINSNVDRLSSLLALLERNGFGYHLGSSLEHPLPDEGQFQDIMVYAYRKSMMS